MQKKSVLQLLIKENIDILIITETKIDDSFPTSQFCIKGYSEPYILDRNKHGEIYTRRNYDICTRRYS